MSNISVNFSLSLVHFRYFLPLYFCSLPVLQFSLPHIFFSLPEVNVSLHPPPQIFSTCPILPRSKRVLYSAVTCTLSGFINVHCSRPIPAHPPTHPAQPTTGPPPHPHPAPPGPPPHPTTRPRPARNPSRPPGPTSPAIPPPGPTRPAQIYRRRGRHRGMIGAKEASMRRQTSARRGSGVNAARERRQLGAGAASLQATAIYLL